jgi:phage shock protein E
MNQLIYLIPILLIVVIFVAKQRSFASEEQVNSALKKGAKVIDVRSPQEYASGHVPKAINIPVNELKERVAQLAPDKEQPLLLHCGSGVRSGYGKSILEKLGYKQVLNVGSYGRATKLLNAS